MKLNTLEYMFLDELKDVYHSELQLYKAFPKLIKASTCPQLRSALEKHWEDTKRHAERLEEVFKLLNKPAKAKKCETMEDLLVESQEVYESKVNSNDMRDVLIICMVQKIEYYEIASYGTLCAWARVLGHRGVVKLLTQSLSEEKMAEEKLGELAAAKIIDETKEMIPWNIAELEKSEF